MLFGAIQLGLTDIVKFILGTVGYRPATHDESVALFDSVISKGHVDILQFMLDKIGVDGQLPKDRGSYASCVDQSITKGHLEMVRFISGERFKEHFHMNAQSSYNQYHKMASQTSGSSNTAQFVDYMKTNHSVNIPPGSFKMGLKNIDHDLDAVISISEAGCKFPLSKQTTTKWIEYGKYDAIRYLYYNQYVDRDDKDSFVGELMKASSRGLWPFVDLPMAEMVLLHKDGAPFIQREYVGLDHLKNKPLSLRLLPKYLMK
ncbi:hypothetical protein SAMD00019534_036120 [Acytostelium subglobosum LB1]|uniref:hypothetical protein n=1 Tax=Acytostelium subglobosum LB1 TaxID=1410327 RepID=UPI0006452076|nr:hypothetical protein SAMD00019534_036120 [Acytostelium subglobosum LB1]GAM20437.1 hypothetical protein SAMD00019534_036120 [Acytostelium subglobosum LB1]|eukprot:XP_012759958.1 hypothetical protein SAMD00019534_036120 [Acytostelium subglobosum LB1]